MSKNKDYQKRLHAVIPGGAHTYSRGDDQYPENAPSILENGKGAYVWDAEGNKFLDYGMGLRSITVGYDYDEISAAAFEAIKKGVNLTRASVTELEAAELMVSLFPWAQMVKFGKSGSTVTTAAVKLSRAYTGRKHVAMCAEHPFFTYDDWFIGTTPMDKGIPQESKSFSHRFNYNNIESLEKIFNENPGQIACVILEPTTFMNPCPDSKTMLDKPECKKHIDKSKHFLHQVQALCKKNGAVFILDEMITGFRFDLHGAMNLFDIEPDLATFGKGMANGFPLSALIGKKEIMNLGGILEEGQERVFLISTTHGCEMSSLGAFIKTVEVYKREKVTDHLWDYGKKLITGMNTIAKDLGVEEYFEIGGYSVSPVYFTKDKNKNVSMDFRTLFSQEMIKNGVLIPWVALCYVHKEEELKLTLAATERALTVYKKALEGDVKDYLVGKAIKPVFRKYN
ncbi:MAG TPA: glutamate-1-semialdehyde 2,1-aminomutase [Bacteroidia bacterium]|jgi:glutamate-1-semialdehyde 2,1-aminomutase|nr:glutamate-1-semialdehyde 2,1-aminomutase [Bacteroidia bacterium]